MKKCQSSLIYAGLILFFSTSASSCPDNLAEQLYHHLKKEIDWVDVNVAAEPLKMRVRYYPCSASGIPINQLITGFISNVENCQLLNQSIPRKIENYCYLDLAFSA